METLPVNTLRALAAARNIALPPIASRSELAKILNDARPPEVTYFGIPIRAPPEVQALELRLLPALTLRRILENDFGVHVFSKAKDVLARDVLIQERRRLGFPELTPEELNKVTETLEMSNTGIATMQKLTGSLTNDRVALTLRMMSPDPVQTLSSRESQAWIRYQELGFVLSPSNERILIPVEKPSTLNTTWLKSAIENGWDFSFPGEPTTLSRLGVYEQVLAELNFPVERVGTIDVRGSINLQRLLILARYPPAPWANNVYSELKLISAPQRKQLLVGALLLPPTTTDGEVQFFWTRGYAIPNREGDLNTLQPSLMNVFMTRWQSLGHVLAYPAMRSEKILLALNGVLGRSDAEIRQEMKRLGVLLPAYHPLETLLQTLWLYDWIDPNAPNLLIRLQGEIPTLEMLRQYDDLTLEVVRPRFGRWPRNRGERIQQCVDDLGKNHYFCHLGNWYSGTRKDAVPVDPGWWNVQGWKGLTRNEKVQIARQLPRIENRGYGFPLDTMIEAIRQDLRSESGGGIPGLDNVPLVAGGDITGAMMRGLATVGWTAIPFSQLPDEPPSANQATIDEVGIAYSEDPPWIDSAVDGEGKKVELEGWRWTDEAGVISTGRTIRDDYNTPGWAESISILYERNGTPSNFIPWLYAEEEDLNGE
jgi:hypothetical protein